MRRKPNSWCNSAARSPSAARSSFGGVSSRAETQWTAALVSLFARIEGRGVAGSVASGSGSRRPPFLRRSTTTAQEPQIGDPQAEEIHLDAQACVGTSRRRWRALPALGLRGGLQPIAALLERAWPVRHPLADNLTDRTVVAASLMPPSLSYGSMPPPPIWRAAR